MLGGNILSRVRKGKDYIDAFRGEDIGELLLQAVRKAIAITVCMARLFCWF
jgi:hypothetical protein